MKISLNWLRDYVDFDGSPGALADLLTSAGIEVEGIHARGVFIDKVVVARIVSSEPHPNADRLSVCRVDDGSGQQPPRQIVCGAKNYRVGDKVPLALPGAVLPGDFRIKVGKLRGVESEGMLCSGKELGVAEDAAGLLILPAEARVGAPISELFPADTIFDLEITPNRADLLSHAGLAREVAALTGKNARWPGELAWRECPEHHAHAREISVDVAPEAAGACPFYTAYVIVGVTAGPSPEWLRRRLESVGLRSVNNVVDVTNFVLMEMGQPLHAFDAEKVRPGLDPAMTTPLQTGIHVRFARAGEPLHALDGRAYVLAPHHLVIAERDGRVLALAGIMGGEETAVGTATRTVILESAYFSPAGIRRTSRELGLASDSSYRFERGVDLTQVDDASLRAAELIVKVAGGEARGLYAAEGERHLAGFPLDGRTIAFRAQRCERLIGAEISADRTGEILSRFGLTQIAEPMPPVAAGTTLWRVPSYRQDLTREVDLIEEVVRVMGLEAVPSQARARFVAVSPADRAYDFQMAARRRLTGLGFAEARTSSVVSEAAAAWMRGPAGGGSGLRLKNPLSEEQTTLRPSVLPGLLAAMGHNARMGIEDVRLFELGRVFNSGAVSNNGEEGLAMGVVWTGGAQGRSWRRWDVRTADMHDLRGILEALLPRPLRIRMELATVEPAGSLAVAAKIRIEDAQGKVRNAGWCGQLRPSRAKELDLPARGTVLMAEVDFGVLHELAAAAPEAVFEPLPRFPSVTRDLAIIVNHGVRHGDIQSTLLNAGEKLLVGVDLFDLFMDPAGEKVPAGKKSLAYSLTYRSADRTLRAEEVNVAHERLKAVLAAAFDLRFRE